MYGNIDEFSMDIYLDKTYPITDDTKNIDELVSYIEESLDKKNNISKSEKETFLSSFTSRIRAISILCKGYDDMDTCEVDAVAEIKNSIEIDLRHLLRDRSEILSIFNGSYFMDLSTIPDAIKFYKHILRNPKIKSNMSRKNLEKMYQECNLDSSFSNVLFDLSWLGILKVYSSSLIYFNNKPPVIL